MIKKKTIRKPGAGRPEFTVDQNEIFELAKIHCTLPEISACAGISIDTLRDKYSAIIEKGYEEGKRSLRRMQYKAAEDGNVTMLVWLGKNLLKQTEGKELTLNFDEAIMKDLLDKTRNPLVM